MIVRLICSKAESRLGQVRRRLSFARHTYRLLSPEGRWLALRAAVEMFVRGSWSRR